jgi:hypothetical protein
MTHTTQTTDIADAMNSAADVMAAKADIEKQVADSASESLCIVARRRGIDVEYARGTFGQVFVPDRANATAYPSVVGDEIVRVWSRMADGWTYTTDEPTAAADEVTDDELAQSAVTSGKLRARFKYEHLGLTDAKVTVDGHDVEDCDGFTLKHEAGALPHVELSFLVVEGNGSVDVSDLDAEVTIATHAVTLPQPGTHQREPDALTRRAPRLALMRGGSLDNKLKLIPRRSDAPEMFAMCVRFPAVTHVEDGVVTIEDEFYQNIHGIADERGYDKLLHYQYVGTATPYTADTQWRGALSWAMADRVHNGEDVDAVIAEAMKPNDAPQAEA